MMKDDPPASPFDFVQGRMSLSKLAYSLSTIHRSSPSTKLGGIIGLAVLGGLALALYWPISYRPAVQPRPAGSYQEAAARIEQVMAEDKSRPLYSGCASYFISHGQKVERAIILLHGYRNCPKQFQQLGQSLHKSGYNVFIPRMPHMGLADVMSEEQAELKADELAVYLTEAVDIGQGLGERVTVAGISTGAVLAGWAAQTRADVERAVLIAPVFGLYTIPAEVTTPVVRIFLVLPNFFLWQDAELKADVPNPEQVYPQNSTRAISQILRLSFAVRAAARTARPAAGSIYVITNANDEAVDNRIAAEVVANWGQQGVADLRSYEFRADLGLDHDLLDPEHPKQRTELVYPVLIELITDDE